MSDTEAWQQAYDKICGDIRMQVWDHTCLWEYLFLPVQNQVYDQIITQRGYEHDEYPVWDHVSARVSALVRGRE